MLSVQAARVLALSLPGAEERDHFGSPSFRVGGKIFAQLSVDASVARALLKLSPADQAALTMSDPETFVPEPQWGRYGWTYVALGTVAPALFEGLLRTSWQTVAPKRFVASSAARR